MKLVFKTLAVGLLGAGILAFAAAPAVCADEFCAMSGMLIKATVVKDKALDWGKDLKKATIAGEDTDSWSVLTLSRTDEGIAILVGPGAVFFGVAGKDRREKIDAGDAEKAFGKGFGKLKEAVTKGMTDLWKSGAVNIEGADVNKIAGAAGLGTLEKSGRDWALTTSDCTGVDLDTSDLK